MLKLIFSLLCIGIANGARECWHCENARSNQQCLAEGRLETCRVANAFCAVEVRLENGLNIMTKRCKQNVACENNEQRMAQRNRFLQCLKSGRSPPNKYCYCCCDGDLCNKRSVDCDIGPIPTTTPPPQCRKCVPNISAPDFGRVRCSDRNCVGSECSFECDDPRDSIFPASSKTLECLPTLRWDKRRPCCAKKCPPTAKVDIAIVLDSSSSIKDRNWVVGKEFVETILRVYRVGEDTTRYAIFRFNENVDNETLIEFNTYFLPRDLSDGLEQIQYNGRGTKTGKALEFLRDNVLIQDGGHRFEEGVPTVIILFTDGRAKDKPEIVAEELRNKKSTHLLTVWVKGQQPRDDDEDLVADNADGLEAMAAPIDPAEEELATEAQLRAIAGEEENYFEFQSFSELEGLVMRPAASEAFAAPGSPAIDPDIVIDDIESYEGQLRAILNRIRQLGCNRQCRN